MEKFSSLLDSQIQIFIITLIGFLISKYNIVNKQQRAGLTNLVMFIVLPANIIYSFFIEMTPSILHACLVVLIISIVVQVFSVILGLVLYKNTPKEKQAVLEYATICSNAGFLGSPLVDRIYGSLGLLYASIYLIPQRIFMWSAGISRFTNTTRKEVIKKVLTHPCIIAVGIGILIMIFQIKFPPSINTSIQSLSNCTTALSMLVIGGILSDVNFKTILEKTTIYFTILRLIIIPAIVFVFCYFLKIDPLVTSVSTILSGMPAGTTTALLAATYNGDEKFAAKCIFVSTLLSLITIPSWAIFMSYVLY